MIELRFKELKESDIISLTPIMRDAFNLDSRMHLGKDGGPDGYDDGSFLKKWALNPYAASYCIYGDEILIGAVVLWINKDGRNCLGCIFIEPKYENMGIGLRVWKKIESLYPDTISWRVETPIFSRRNHNFYINKCGFHAIRIENPKSIEDGMFVFEKIMRR